MIHTKWHATYVRYASSILSPKRFNWSNRIPIRCSGVHAKQNTMEIVKSIRLVRRALSLSSGFSARTILYELTGYFIWERSIILSVKPKCNDWISLCCTFSVRNAHAQYLSFQERETSTRCAKRNKNQKVLHRDGQGPFTSIMSPT